MINEEIKVVKRDGRVEDLDLNKIHVMVEAAARVLVSVPPKLKSNHTSLSMTASLLPTFNRL